MDRILTKLERTLGRFAIEHMIVFVIGGMAIAYVAMMARPEFAFMLELDLRMVARGQVWRLVSFLFIPRETSPFWFLFDLYWLWLIGSGLEAQWGAFKLNVYYFVGILGTIAAAVISHAGGGNFDLNLSLLLAFATVFPEFEFLLFFLLPMKVKWLGWIAAGYLVLEVIRGDWATRAAIVAALANYFLFFSGTLVSIARGQRVQMKQAARRASMRAPSADVIDLRTSVRQCAICGATEADGADIRVCSCDKCKATGAGTRTLCLEHARNH